jgi:hypothetical protein
MSPLSRLQSVEEAPYPPAPWDAKGQLWMGFFKTDTPVQLPAGLKYLLDPHSLLVTVVRYLEGTLCYDELAFGTLARMGSRVGICTDCIWVTDLASLWGGRRIWGVPKNLAKFAWSDSTVRVTDEQGLIATIKVDMSPAKSPWVWMPSPAIGQLESGAWVYAVGGLWALFGGANMQVEEWSTRFGYQLGNKPALSFGAKPFRLHLPAAKVISP